jgi:hypothetical protein
VSCDCVPNYCGFLDKIGADGSVGSIKQNPIPRVIMKTIRAASALPILAVARPVCPLWPAGARGGFGFLTAPCLAMYPFRRGGHHTEGRSYTMQTTKEVHNEQPAKGSPSHPGQGNPPPDRNATEKQGQKSGQQAPPKVHDDLKRQDQEKTGKR